MAGGGSGVIVAGGLGEVMTAALLVIKASKSAFPLTANSEDER